ncbi:histidine kinase [Leptospira wolffii]|uniref:histidine kinase n=1 Tax=Leptospira wolffii TaxID=409998 RepID=A0A2M9Z7U7_9LEPT|nr:ATP-binding protein [Leptospira wolffii]PJZ64509.1 histidine kinase [Leptospira wolffii]
MSLRTRFSIYCAAVLITFSVTLTLIVVVFSYYDARVSSQETAMAKAETASFEVRRVFSDGMNRLANLKTRWELTRPSRESAEKELLEMFEKDKRFLGSWTIFETNSFDGPDFRYVGRKGSGPTGRFIPYFHRDLENSEIIKVDPILGFEKTDGTADYYQVPKKTMNDYMGEPYSYPVDGRNTFLISLARPVIRGGRFAGVVGLDLRLADLEKEFFLRKPFGDKGYLALISPGGKYATHGGKAILQGKAAGSSEVRSNIRNLLQKEQPFGYAVENGQVYIFPFRAGNYSEHWGIEVFVPDSVLWSDLWSIVFRSLLITFTLLPVCLYFIDRFFCRYVSEGISSASGFADSLGGGDFLAQIPNREFKDEIYHLFVTLENMKEKLLLAIDQQLRSEKILRESKEINSRNEIIRLQKEELETALGELKATQEILLRNERLAAIGRISGAVSHQINNPLGAMNAARENVSFYTLRIVELLPFLMIYLPQAAESERSAFSLALSEILENGKETIGKKFRQTRHAIEAFLKEQEISFAGDKAAIIAELGFLSCPKSLLTLCESEEWDRISEFFMAMRGIYVSEEVIHRSTDKMYKIVSALETYSGIAKEGSERIVKLSDTMEAVLGVYEGAGGNRVLVERFYISDAVMKCVPEDLVRLWTQVVDNAYQAMSGEGNLKIRIFDADAKVICEVEDDGPGIPSSLKERIGEALFSGKSEGEGAGIGLAVAASISKKYGGSWTWESIPGRTVFRFSFPRFV